MIEMECQGGFKAISWHFTVDLEYLLYQLSLKGFPPIWIFCFNLVR